jgi:hypothetical protein
MNETITIELQRNLISSASTRKGYISVHHFIPEGFFVITLSDSKNPVEGMIERVNTLKEANAVARGLYKGIEIVS